MPSRGLVLALNKERVPPPLLTIKICFSQNYCQLSGKSFSQSINQCVLSLPATPYILHIQLQFVYLGFNKVLQIMSNKGAALK